MTTIPASYACGCLAAPPTTRSAADTAFIAEIDAAHPGLSDYLLRQLSDMSSGSLNNAFVVVRPYGAWRRHHLAGSAFLIDLSPHATYTTATKVAEDDIVGLLGAASFYDANPVMKLSDVRSRVKFYPAWSEAPALLAQLAHDVEMLVDLVVALNPLSAWSDVGSCHTRPLSSPRRYSDGSTIEPFDLLQARYLTSDEGALPGLRALPSRELEILVTNAELVRPIVGTIPASWLCRAIGVLPADS